MRAASASIVTYEINKNDRVEEVPTGWTFTAEGVGKATWHKTQASSLAAPVFNADIKVGMYMPDAVLVVN